MNEATTQPTWIRRYVPLAVAVLFGAALAVFAGLSAGGDDDATASGVGFDTIETAVDREELLDATAADLTLPTHDPLELDAVEPPPIAVDGPSVDLRLLILEHGANADTAAADQLREILDVIGIPYDTFDAAEETLTLDRLRRGDRGLYNGIILADAELQDGTGVSGLDAREWTRLRTYARDFGVRQSILSGFPGTEGASYDYGMAGAELVDGTVGIWTPAGREVFGGVATDGPLVVEGPAFVSSLGFEDGDPRVEPLLVEESSDRPLISMLTYPDGREVLLSTIAMGPSRSHSYALVYDFVVFATSGVHLGVAQSHLATHVDDLFLDHQPWDTSANEPSPQPVRTTAKDIEAIVALQRGLEAEFDTLSSYRVDFPFNGAGAALPGDDEETGDELTDAVLRHADELRFINHTYQHLDLDISAGATEEDARIDFLRNRAMWEVLGLPGADLNASAVVTGEHSGVEDNPETGEEPTPFPGGLNEEMATAFERSGVRYLAGDTSRVGQAQEQAVPGFDLVLLPRDPTGLLLNATSPDELVDQYNWFFNERLIEAGQDPCEIPAAVCETVDYQRLVEAEAIAGVRRMLSFRRWPLYLHMANVVDYDGEGSTLLGDWLEAVMAEYESRSSLPVENLSFAEIGERTEAELEARAANPVGVLDLDRGEVVLAAGREVELRVTGLAGGEPYGPVLQSTVAVGPEPTPFAVG